MAPTLSQRHVWLRCITPCYVYGVMDCRLYQHDPHVMPRMGRKQTQRCTRAARCREHAAGTRGMSVEHHGSERAIRQHMSYPHPRPSVL
jgi:hypothetical protein